MKPHLPCTLACSLQDVPWHDFGGAGTGKEAVPGQGGGGRLCLAGGAHCVFYLVEWYLVGSCWERGLLSRRLRSRLSGPPLVALSALRGLSSRATLGDHPCSHTEVLVVVMLVCVRVCARPCVLVRVLPCVYVCVYVYGLGRVLSARNHFHRDGFLLAHTVLLRAD